MRPQSPAIFGSVAFLGSYAIDDEGRAISVAESARLYGIKPGRNCVARQQDKCSPLDWDYKTVRSSSKEGNIGNKIW